MNDFHSGLLSKGPEESADGDHDHHLRHHHRHNIRHYHWLWSSGQVGTVSHPKVQTLSNRTPDAQPAIAMEGGAADRNHSGEGQGGTHTTGNHRGEGGYHGVGGGGGRGGLAALHHIYIYIYLYLFIYIYIFIYLYIYICSPPQDLHFRGSWGMRRTKHCNAQQIPKFPTSELTTLLRGRLPAVLGFFPLLGGHTDL